MVSKIILLFSLLSAVLSVVHGDTVKRMTASAFSPTSVAEAGKAWLSVDFTMEDDVPAVPRGQRYIIKMQCTGYNMRDPLRSFYSNGGQTTVHYRAFVDVVATFGPTRCQAHLEYKGVMLYKVEGGFDGPSITPKPAKPIFAKYLEFASYNVTVGATQVLKIGIQHEPRFLPGNVSFNITFPTSWKVDCNVNFNGPAIVENGVTYVGLHTLESTVCSTDNVVTFRFRDIFFEPTPCNGVYFSIPVTLPKEVEKDFLVIHKHWIHLYTADEPFGFPALKQQGTYFTETGIRIIGTERDSPIVAPPHLSIAPVIKARDRFLWGFTVDIKKMVKGVPGGRLRVFAPNFYIVKIHNRQPSLWVCEAGDQLRPDWITDDMDLARNLNGVQAFWSINVLFVPIPDSMDKIPEKLFFAIDTNCPETPWGPWKERRQITLTVESPNVEPVEWPVFMNWPMPLRLFR
eukprot:Platyproteum_vivax@DN7371_c1_g1_i1.p1